MPREFSLVVNVEFALLPIVGWSTVADGAAVVVRQWPAQAKRALKRAEDQLRSGRSFGISVEGRRSLDGSLSHFKKGAAVLAIGAQCDIVPFMTHGEWELWPRGQRRIKKRSHRGRRVSADLDAWPDIRGSGHAHRASPRAR